MIPITLYASKVLYHLLSPQHKSQQDKYQKDQLCSKQQETFKRLMDLNVTPATTLLAYEMCRVARSIQSLSLFVHVQKSKNTKDTRKKG